MRLGMYILRLFKLSSNSLRSTLYFTKINLRYVTFLNHSPFGLFHKNLIFPVGVLHLLNCIFQCRIPESSNPLPLCPSRPLPLEHNRQSRMVQQLNQPHPNNSWVEEAQKPSTGQAPPPAASTLL